MTREAACSGGRREWPAELDVAALRRAGLRPTPIHEFVLKLHARCNLACDYCYLYEMADQSWRDRPPVVSSHTIRQTVARIAEHVSAHRLGRIKVVLHGGEPLLAGARRVEGLHAELLRAVPPGTAVDLVVQTNATLLDADWLRVLDRLGIRIGVSVDGGGAAHDRHRRRRDGAGSYASVARALTLLGRPENRHLFAGLLCTVDLANDPLDTYEDLLRWRPPMVDFLLPHGNWSTPPPGWTGAPGLHPYGDWLVTVFDRWYGSRPLPTEVRLFGDVLSLVLGGRARTDQVGLSPYSAVVVETDGSIEQTDSLKSAYHGAAATGLSVMANSFDDVLALPSMAARQLGYDALAPACRACPMGRVCGGGSYVHRYRAGTGFRNPSVYCADLFRLVTHVRGVVGRDVAALLDGRPT